MSDSHIDQYQRVVVALNGGTSDARIVRLAAETTRENKAELIAIHVVEIDWTLPLDADIAGRSEEVQRVLDMAEAVAESSAATSSRSSSRPATSGAALVDEAAERDADLLVARRSPTATGSAATSPSAGPSPTS